MGNYPTLSKAPIVEALADIQFSSNEETSLDRLNSFHQAIKQQFPTSEQRKRVEFNLSTDSNGNPHVSTSGEVMDLLLSSDDKKRILQIGLNRFTYSRLAPYSTGEEFNREASELWHLFSSVVKPNQIGRLAQRCINRIEIPLPLNDFDEYFQTFVRLSPTIPQGIAELFARFVLPFPGIGERAAVVTFQMEHLPPQPAPLPDKVVVLFDIDVSQVITKNLATDKPSEEVWNIMQELREYRNQIFFESLTPKALEMYR